MDKFAKDGLIVNAQEYKKWRSLLSNPLSGVGRGISEHIFSSYREMMDKLRETDDSLRAIALGDSNLNISVKDAIAKSKSALKENRLIDALYYSAVINLIAKELLAASSETVKGLREALYAQYGTEYAPEALDYVKNLREAEYTPELEKQAQFWQGVYRSLFGDPLLKSWEKEIKKFRGPVENAVNKSEMFGNNLMAVFDQMGIARAKGKIGDWVGALDTIAKLQPRYENDIMRAYVALKPIIEATKQDKQKAQTVSKDVSGEQLDNIISTPTPEPIKTTTPPVAKTQPMENPVITQAKSWVANALTDRVNLVASILNKFINSDISDGFIRNEQNNVVAKISNGKITISDFPMEDLNRETAKIVIGVIDNYSPVNVIIEGKGSKKPVKERKIGRPPKKAVEFMGGPEAFRKFLEDQGKTEQEIQDAFATVGMKYDDGYDEITDSEIEYVDEPSSEAIVQKYDNAIEAMPQLAIINVINTLEDSVASDGEDQTITDDQGNIVAQIDNGIISVEGIEIPVELAPRLLAAYKRREIPELPVKIGPSSDKPIPLPGKIEAPKPVEEPKPKKEKAPPKVIEEVSPTENVLSEEPSERVIIFTDVKHPDDLKTLKALNKVLDKPVTVLSTTNRGEKEKYPTATYYAFRTAPVDDEKELPESVFELLGRNSTKGIRAKIKEILGVSKKRPAKEKAPAKEAPEKTTEKPSEKAEVPNESRPVVLGKGTAQYEGTVASVNADVVGNFTKKSAADPIDKAAGIVILLTGAITGAEIYSAQAALESYFEKETRLFVDRQWALKEVDKMEKDGPVAVFMWDRESFRSVMKFTKASQPTATASVEQAVLKLAHKRFYNNLQKVATEFEDPYLMANMMLQYSEAIEDKDPELSYELLAKAQEIIEDE